MSDNLWLIVLRETFLSVDILLVLVVPLLLFLATVVYFRLNPLGASEAWNRVGRRFMTLGAIFAFPALALYLICAAVPYKQRAKYNGKYIETLNKAFRERFNQKDFPTRMLAFAQRIAKPEVISGEINKFAKELPDEERILFLESCYGNGKRKGWGEMAEDGFRITMNAFYVRTPEGILKAVGDGLPVGMDVLEKLGLLDISSAGNVSEWLVLLPDPAWEWFFKAARRQWTKTDLGHLRSIAERFGKENKGKPTKSVEKLYGSIADKACPTELQKMSVYLQDKPKTAKFVKFCLGYRFWVRSGVPALILLIVGLVMISKGKGIAADGMRRKLFK